MKKLSFLFIVLALISTGCSDSKNTVGQVPITKFNQAQPLPPVNNGGGLIPGDQDPEEMSRVTCEVPYVFTDQDRSSNIKARSLLNSFRGQRKLNRITVYKVLRKKNGQDIAAFSAEVDGLFDLRGQKEVNIRCHQVLGNGGERVPTLDTTIDIPSIVNGNNGRRQGGNGFEFEFEFGFEGNWEFGTPGFNGNARDPRRQQQRPLSSQRFVISPERDTLTSTTRRDNYGKTNFLDFFAGSNKTKTTYKLDGDRLIVIVKKIGVDVNVAGQRFEVDTYTAVEYDF